MKADIKIIDVKESKWRKKTDELRTFGWILVRAIKYVERTMEMSYEGRVEGDRIYIEPHTNTTEKTWVELTFKRYSEMYCNLSKIYPLEFLYGILCCFLAIAKWVISAFLVLMILSTVVGGTSDSVFGVVFAMFLTCVLCWLILLLLKRTVLRIAKSVLKEKHFYDKAYNCNDLDEFDLRN